MSDFCHLHCHTQYSLLDGAAAIGAMMDKAAANQMKAVALTDHGNMFGAFHFANEAHKRGIKPILGCEFYLVSDRHKQSFSKSIGERDIRYHQLLLAKNRKGYENLSKLCSLGFMEGSYGKFPRIDKELVSAYKEGVIATSCCIGAIVPQLIINQGAEVAEKELMWWMETFGDDYYIELQRHHIEDIDGTGISQEEVNQILLGFADKYNIPVIATNDSHYINEDDWQPHEILLCVNTGSKLSDPPGHGKGKRFAFPNSEFYFKTQDEMKSLFRDVPRAIENTMAVYDKIESLKLSRDILLPSFNIPDQFNNQKEFLRHLSIEGIKRKYGSVSEAARERLDYEVGIIADMGFEGYFLIVQDFMHAAREMGVAVGPGRGSAAGSLVAYALGITNIDPLKYNLLFERFLNPERISMPDIDIDFDDEGRQKVIDWVVDKYGKQQVAQIVTFGTMAAKSSIRDVARVLDLPLRDADLLAKLVPARPGVSLKKILTADQSTLKEEWSPDEIQNILKLRETLGNKEEQAGKTLDLAMKLEGSVRNTGIHAAGIIIAPDELTKYIPVCTSRDTDLLVTQFDGSVVENAGMLKMDFLGLKTLSIIKDAIEIIKKRHGAEAGINPDDIPLDDPKTFELFQRGDMVGIFQFESEGMQKYLKELKPTSIEDLIAMNALYRPGPMSYIDLFIRRKHGKEPIDYPHPWLEEILQPTYGIMVYQEQIMQTAQIMAGYSLGQADVLRRAMGKKKASEMDKQKEVFITGAAAKGVDEKKAIEIFDVMAKFASYGFNRSHAAAYSVVAFQTAYLKAHYTAEFMAAVLTHNKKDITKLNFFLRECKRIGITVLGPDVNASDMDFTVDHQGRIRFGLSALKSVGESAVKELIRARNEHGPFTDIFDMTSKISLSHVNKKCLESMALGGAFDCFSNAHRAQYFAPVGKFDTLLSAATRFGQSVQEQKNNPQLSLFGGTDLQESSISPPDIPDCEPWNHLELLEKEKEVTGIFVSGHPLDKFLLEIRSFTNIDLNKVNILLSQPQKAAAWRNTLKFAGFITAVQHRTTQSGTGYGFVTLQDYKSSIELRLFNTDYSDNKNRLEPGQSVFVSAELRQRNNGQEFYLNRIKISLLSEVLEKNAKALIISKKITSINQNWTNNLADILKDHTGNQKLYLEIEHPENKHLGVQLLSRKHSVLVNELLLEKLNAMGENYRIN